MNEYFKTEREELIDYIERCSKIPYEDRLKMLDEMRNMTPKARKILKESGLEREITGYEIHFE